MRFPYVDRYNLVDLSRLKLIRLLAVGQSDRGHIHCVGQSLRNEDGRFVSSSVAIEHQYRRPEVPLEQCSLRLRQARAHQSDDIPMACLPHFRGIEKALHNDGGIAAGMLCAIQVKQFQTL